MHKVMETSPAMAGEECNDAMRWTIPWIKPREKDLLRRNFSESEKK